MSAIDHAVGSTETETETAIAIMDAFAARTGPSASAASKRYLWTDAFAVENDLALAVRTGDARFERRAFALIDDVHRVLGRHRADDVRRGPLSGDDEASWAAHPTRGGLRIGKALPERRADEPYDSDLEWERDGQYFHYATRWMEALARAARQSGRSELLVWARELAFASHRAFVRGPARDRRIVWKMSIDLGRPLVDSSGQHDALDGFVTCARLQSAAPSGGPSLAPALAELASLVEPRSLATADPLGIGALLVDACRLESIERAPLLQGAPVRASDLLEAALVGLAAYVPSGALSAPLGRRLAFRELGLAIGLCAVERMAARRIERSAAMQRALAAAVGFVPVRDRIVGGWLAPAGRRVIRGAGHEDIDEVMLASCLVPEGHLGD